MSEPEQEIGKRIQLALAKCCTLFRNNTGLGWVGKSTRFGMQMNIRVAPGDVLIKQARPLHAGLCKGGSDYVGWTPVKITPEMVGKTVAVFTGIEVKTPDGRRSPEQKNFVAQVEKHGGFACFATSPTDASAYIEDRLRDP